MIGIHWKNPLPLKKPDRKKLIIFEVDYLKRNYDKRKCNKTISRPKGSGAMG